MVEASKKKVSEVDRIAASFRDPSGFLYRRGGHLYRQVNHSYRDDYRTLMDSGLYDELVQKGALVPHQEVDVEPANPQLAYTVLQPETVPFISYPYEWSFGQLKDAALLTLRLQRRALAHELTLKDASAYNIQFPHGQPILIDSLSFERRRSGEPWAAYRQFCQHFLAPLALASRRDIRLAQLLRVHIDGIPLDLTSRLLPRRTYLQFGLLVHLHLHAGAQSRLAGRRVSQADSRRRMDRRSLDGLVASLESAIKGLNWQPVGSWADYYQTHNYEPDAFQAKRDLVKSLASKVKADTALDLGANTGEFSRIVAELGVYVVAADVDPGAVELNYERVREHGERQVHPLWVDLTNPAPSQGWAHGERDSLAARSSFDLVMALALIHHLTISNNLPFSGQASYLAQLGRHLVIEFVPKSDPQAQRLLASRLDIFTDYTLEEFERAFGQHYRTIEKAAVPGTDRTIYLMAVHSH